MKTRTNKFRGKRIWLFIEKLFKGVLKSVYYFIVGITYLIVKGYITLEKALLKGFKKFPLWLKRIIMWVLIINVFTLSNKGADVIEKIVTNIEVEEVYIIKEVVKEETKCSLGVYECAIYNQAMEYGLTEEQTKIAIAISKHETADYTSNIFVNKNNIGGLYNSNDNTFYKFDTLEDGIKTFIGTLKKGYFDKGLNTIKDIQTKYAPLEAANDPTNLNANWVSGVQRYYNELG